MATPEDKLQGFDPRAADYVTKSYAMTEPFARISTLLTRPRFYSHHETATPHSDRLERPTKSSSLGGRKCYHLTESIEVCLRQEAVIPCAKHPN
jgi:DNA-binding response OmpR family regulator